MEANAGGQIIVVELDIKQAAGSFSGTTTSDLGGGTVENGAVSGNKFVSAKVRDSRSDVRDADGRNSRKRQDGWNH